MHHLEEDINSLFMLRFGMEDIFFKDFAKLYETPDEINMTQMRTMVILSIHGPMAMSVLSKIMLLEKGSFTPIAKKLIKLSYLEKISDETDKRKSLLKVTEKGSKLAEDYKSSHIKYIRKVLSKLTKEEQEVYLKHIDIVNSINMKLGLRPPGYKKCQE